MRRAALAILLMLITHCAEARDGRNAGEVRKFRLGNPCPVTGQVRGKCPGYEVDHVQARRCGGADKASNIKVVREIERVEVPKLVTKIEWLHHTETQLIEAANAAPPNPAACDLDAERVRRINQSATANPG